jgi:dihydrofolate reductase
MIVAMSHDGIIGIDGHLPWRLSADLRRFKQLTLGNIVLMGRKTYESIDPPLRNRTIVVATKRLDYKVVNGYATSDLLSTIERYKNDKLFIAGGAEIYEQALPYTERLYTTIVRQGIKEDDIDKAAELKYFPQYSTEDWALSYREADDDVDYIIWNRIDVTQAAQTAQTVQIN